jgi:hypothetical protein
MTSHCRHQRSLSTYVDGELKASQVRQLEAHLTDPAVAAPLWPGVRARIEAGRPPGLLTTWIRRIWEAGWERPARRRTTGTAPRGRGRTG